ncbi:exosome complex exonuclease RRP6 [Thraustotheca clavata]|uniref:Exosome complex exonuclease RRP6 n=1 Tax=Thraustotheca clavata TaxID=74557 RepID=A0A1W0A4V5_9STRA|nr:exosome complex exonuclease RRP6 [Thraustotheca clavata]
MSEHDDADGLILREKRKRVKPTIFQVEIHQVKKRKKKIKLTKSAQRKLDAENEKLKVKENNAKPLEMTEFTKLMSKPIYREDSSEWHGKQIDMKQIGILRQMWQLPAACHILWLLQRPHNLQVYKTLSEYEEGLLDPKNSPVLENIFTKLLLGKKERDRLAAGLGLPYNVWNEQLHEHYTARYHKWWSLKKQAGVISEENNEDSASDDEAEKKKLQRDLTDDEWALLDILSGSLPILGNVNPLKSCDFHELSPRVRCLILFDLCETTLNKPSNLDYIREMDDNDLRIQCIGSDRLGNRYFCCPQFTGDRRIYRLADKSANEGDLELWVKGNDELQTFYNTFLAATKRGRKIKSENQIRHFIEDMLEKIKEEAHEAQLAEERALKRAILEAMPRKRSARIQELFQEKEEEEATRLVAEAAEAEQKRADYLAEIEREKRAEQKRLAKEREQRESLNIHRETRLQKRMVEVEKQLDTELSARDRRALNRQ